MKKILLLLTILMGSIISLSAQTNTEALKNQVIERIDHHSQDLISLSDAIWEFAEIAFKENQSAKALSDYAEDNGFTVTRGVGEIPTAFTAEFSRGEGPIIGIMGEFDALPGLSQETVPHKSPLIENAPGHGCGHNIFGVASLGAAIAIKELMEAGELEGTIRFYGTPAEEKFFGKLWMIRAGLFDDVDVMMDWHPSNRTEADVQSSLALVDFLVEFYGQAAHASGDPWNGRSAGDALELYTDGINMYREHIKPTVRIHYHIQDAGKVVNVVPDYSKIWVRVRDTKRAGLQEVYERVMAMAEGAAIMANVDHKVSLISGIHEVLPNRTGGAALQANLEQLGSIAYTEEEEEFARAIQRATNKPEVGLDMEINPMKETAEHPMGGSTDVGDVSFITPTIRLRATTAPAGTPWHSWAVVATGGMSIGHKGLTYASKALSMTIIDLFKNPDLINDVKAEFLERKGDYVYEGMIPPGPPPLDFEQ
ncbi:MAG: amidohydrolase [Balneolaceae bacterium]|nr:amidohydrolase [Balneolaceae bacterium]